MKIRVRYHALLREKTGRESEAFELAERTAAGDLLAVFIRKYPAFEKLAPVLHIAVNDEIVRGGAALKEGDRVDLMPPFGGG